MIQAVALNIQNCATYIFLEIGQIRQALKHAWDIKDTTFRRVVISGKGGMAMKSERGT